MCVCVYIYICIYVYIGCSLAQFSDATAPTIGVVSVERGHLLSVQKRKKKMATGRERTTALLISLCFTFHI